MTVQLHNTHGVVYTLNIQNPPISYDNYLEYLVYGHTGISSVRYPYEGNYAVVIRKNGDMEAVIKAHVGIPITKLVENASKLEKMLEDIE